MDSGLSQVLLGVVPNNNVNQITRHESRFGITSFVYRTRRPFHPGRLYNQFMKRYFMMDSFENSEHLSLEQLQNDASFKQANRVELMGELLRSKGFIWIATSNIFIAGWQQAGNILKIALIGPWENEIREENADLCANITSSKSPDRRQELVFIGMKLKHKVIQEALDKCLLTDEEMNMAPEKWDDFMDAEDKINSSMPLQLLFQPDDIITVHTKLDQE